MRDRTSGPAVEEGCLTRLWYRDLTLLLELYYLTWTLPVLKEGRFYARGNWKLRFYARGNLARLTLNLEVGS